MIEHNQIAITGGGGHLGTCLIQLLLKKGYSISALYHNFLPEIEHQNLTWIKGDVTNSESIHKLIKDVTVLIHSASVISVGEKNEDVVYKSNVVGTETIIKACLSKKIRMIYISSSTAVKETYDDEIFDEERPYKTKHNFLYAWTKALSEKNVLASVKQHNLDAIIIRPTAIVGPPDFRMSHFGQIILDMADGKLPAITTGGYNIVDVRDVSQTIVNSIHMGKQGEVYLVGGAYFTMKQVAKLANPKRRIICLSLDLLIVLVPIINIYNKMFPLRWPITNESLMALKLAPKNMDSSKAMKELHHEIRPITETINDLIMWFKENNK